MSKPDELWDKYSCGCLALRVNKHQVLAALAEYGQSVRERDAEICVDLPAFNYDDPGESYAAAISREPLP
jgi:hypothetical protein